MNPIGLSRLRNEVAYGGKTLEELIASSDFFWKCAQFHKKNYNMNGYYDYMETAMVYDEEIKYRTSDNTKSRSWELRYD